MVDWNQAYEISDSKNLLKWRNYKTSVIFGLSPALTGRNYWLSGWETAPPDLCMSLTSKVATGEWHQTEAGSPSAGPPLLIYHWLGFCIHALASHAVCIFPDWLLLLSLSLKNLKVCSKNASMVFIKYESVLVEVRYWYSSKRIRHWKY